MVLLFLLLIHWNLLFDHFFLLLHIIVLIVGSFVLRATHTDLSVELARVGSQGQSLQVLILKRLNNVVPERGTYFESKGFFNSALNGSF